MAIKTIRSTVLAMVAILLPSVAIAQQTPAQMQAQMDAANVPQSTATTTTNKTPLQTYQQWYSAWITNDVKGALATYTNTARQNELGETNPSDQDYVTMSSAMQQAGYSNYQLQSFVFQSNPTRPQITILLGYKKGQLNLVEQFTFVLIDTTTGWRIDSESDQQISQTHS